MFLVMSKDEKRVVFDEIIRLVVELMFMMGVFEKVFVVFVFVVYCCELFFFEF